MRLQKQIKVNPAINVLKDVSRLSESLIFPVGPFVRDLLTGQEINQIDLLIAGDCQSAAGQLKNRLNNSVLTVAKENCEYHLLHESQNWHLTAIAHDSDPDTAKRNVQQYLQKSPFSVNALGIDLTSTEVIDPGNYRNDFRHRTIRTTGDPQTVFDTNPLAMMEAVVLAAQMDFIIDSETWSAIEAGKERISDVAPEELLSVFKKLLAVNPPSRALAMFRDSGLSGIYFPELDALAGVEERKGYHHKDVFWHTLEVTDNISEQSNRFDLRFAAVMHDIAKPQTKRFMPSHGWTFHGHEELGARMTERIGRRLRLDEETISFVSKLVRLHLRPIALVSDTVTDSAVRRLMTEAGEELPDLMTLCRADITSKNPRKVERYLGNFDLVEARMEEVRRKDEERAFQPALKGEEIMNELQLPPGPVIGQIKKAIVAAIRRGEILNEPEACRQYLFKIKDQFL